MSIKRILIIDDEELIRICTQVCLEVTGDWEVLTASSGSEGLTKAETDQPNAILLDLMMPDMDGLTTFKHLQANPRTKNIPVLLLTATVQAEEEHEFAKIGVRAVITKPYDPLALTKQITQALAV